MGKRPEGGRCNKAWQIQFTVLENWQSTWPMAPTEEIHWLDLRDKLQRNVWRQRDFYWRGLFWGETAKAIEFWRDERGYLGSLQNGVDSPNTK